MLVLLMATLACNNPCQKLCHELQDYAMSECNLEFTDDELNACIQDHAGGNLEKGDKGVCRDGGDSIAQEWTCDDLKDYFDDQG